MSFDEEFLEDIEELEDAGIDMDRRDVVKSMGAVGLGLNGVDVSDLVGRTSVTSPDADPGWVVVDSSSIGLPTPGMLADVESYDDEDYSGSMVVSNHGIDYKGAQWVEFGDPRDGIGGCWKHTFVLSGMTAAVQNRAVGSDNLSPDSGAYESTQFVLETHDDDIAISERRDRDLTGFIPSDSVQSMLRQKVTVEDEDGNQKEVRVMEALRDVVASDDDWLTESLKQTADDPTEAAQKKDARSDAVVSIVATVVGVVLTVASGGTALALLAAATAIAPAIIELLSDVEYQPNEVKYSEGISAEWSASDDAMGGGEFVVFDVYVSPEAENASLTVESNNSVRVGSLPFDENQSMLQCKFGFNPKPGWTIEIDGEPRPEDLGDDDPHNARVRGGTRPTHIWRRDGREPPVAIMNIEDSPPTAQSGLTVDASESYALDSTIKSYEWTLRPSPTDGIPQPVPAGGDGGRTQTGETAHFEVARGNYTISLTASDYDGRKVTTSQSVTVTRPPSVSLSASTSTPELNERVEFTASASDPDDEPLTYYWSAAKVGDSSDGPTPGGSRWPYLNGDADTSRTLDAIDPGATVDVTVTVMDPAGATASDTVTIEIPERNPGNGNGKGGGSGPGTSGGSGGEGPGRGSGGGNGKDNGGGNGKGSGGGNDNGRDGKSNVGDFEGGDGLWPRLRGSSSDGPDDGGFWFD
jgi:hypothetical protein